MTKKKTEKWCPLMGAIYKGTPKDVEEIILVARELWDNTETTIGEDGSFRVNLVDGIGSGLTTEKLSRAGKIFSEWIKIRKEFDLEFSLFGNYRSPGNYRGSGKFNPVEDLLYKCRLQVPSSRTSTDYEILAIIAIHEAKTALDFKNRERAVKCIGAARNILETAKELLLLPDVKLGRKRRKQIKEWTGKGRAGRDEDELLKKDWLTIAKEFKPRKGQYSFVAWQIIKRLKLDNKKHQKISRWLSATFKKSL